MALVWISLIFHLMELSYTGCSKKQTICSCEYTAVPEITQRTVATYQWRVGIFNSNFIAVLFPSLGVGEFWKSVTIWWSYGNNIVSSFLINSEQQSTFCSDLYTSVLCNFAIGIKMVFMYQWIALSVGPTVAMMVSLTVSHYTALTVVSHECW